MRKTFGAVVLSGIALAAAWSWVRRAADGDGSTDEPVPGASHADPGSDAAAPSPPKLDSATVRTEPSAAPDDAQAAARAALAPSALVEPSARRRAMEAADRLLSRAAAAPTREGVELRLLARRVFAAVHDCDAASRDERDAAYEASRGLFDVLVRGSGAPPETVLRHKVAAGENVWALARGPWRAAGVTASPGFVLWMNGVPDAKKLRVGQVLKVPVEPLALLVRKRAFELTVTLGGAPFERFPVAVGADAKTPVGVFQAGDCLKNPDWYMNGKRIPFGSPGHIIGTRWIGLRGSADADGIGIHGTNDDASVGTAASMGCIRLRNSDVERLFEWVGAGTRVEIRD